MLLTLVNPNDPVLTRQAEKVVFPDPSLERLAADMMVTMMTHRGCGLAAPQVGVPIRMFIWAEGGETGVVINPVLLEQGEKIDTQEGCLTFTGKRFKTRRASSIWCSYFDLEGRRSGIQTIDGFRAIIFQHEYDHLIGRLLPHHGIEEV
jgi:peptide deformylase